MSIRVKDKMSPSLNRIAKSIQGVPEQAYAYWRSITPKRSGNARRQTRLQGNEIQARYDYASALDAGASKQAPQGMSEPTTQYLDREYKKRIRK
jgi:hypothetical protein